MSKKTTKIAVLILILTTLSFFYFKNKSNTTNTLTLPNNQIINVEIADTTIKQAKGLMYRKSLSQDAGMLFVFEDKAKHVFWMKNTYIPLDMIWLDENMVIVDIKTDIQPCKNGEKCKTYMPANPAKYVLEVNAGVANKEGLKVNDKLFLIQN